ncbi:RicAFT regulatory complex protein RicA family protein [Virgibacillus sp. NKC19-16]|uniref:RicAFT regulatory complex protein RicA family protein n=1 Tax=Virgibacillus salidurans TaxID=2831673 RepID=UPI001F1DB1FC|nr:YlbF family regulator [Virgibacillus sp. NKC19-16]UJL48002.1 RicAFT regulatory complex protein RicA family protein [Virgibacillus sp. NKC19-16]
MAEYTRAQVLEEAKKLADMLASTEEIDRFKQVEAKINDNKKVQQLIKKIKTLQKQAVNFQAYEKKEALKKVEAEIDRLQEEIDGIPVVQEFKETQVVVNDVLQLVSGTIAREVTNNVIESTGGDILAGETGSKAKNSTPSAH